MTDSSRGTFHLSRGKNVDLSLENTMALIGGHIQFLHPGVPTGVLRTTVHPKFDMRRLVFSSKPIGITEIFQVHVTRRQYKKRGPGLSGPESWDFVPDDKGCTFSDAQQNVAIGFIAYDPARLLTIPKDDGIFDSWCHSPDVWMLSEDKAYHDGRKEAKHNLGVYKPTNDTIGCRVNEKGGGLPLSHQSSMAQKDGDSVSLSEIKQKIADLEVNFQKQFDTLRRLFEEGFQQGLQQGQSDHEKK